MEIEVFFQNGLHRAEENVRKPTLSHFIFIVKSFRLFVSRYGYDFSQFRAVTRRATENS